MGVVISGACGRITRVRLGGDGGGGAERQATRPGCVTAVEPIPDGRLLLGTVFGQDPFTVVSAVDLFGR